MRMTVITTPVLEPLLKSHKLSIYAKQLQQYIDEEQRKREAFYDWITEDTKAEFINGEIVMQTPARKQHTDAVVNLTSLLRAFVNEHDLGFLASETVLIALTRNDYLPDVVFFSQEKAAQFSPRQVKYPAPDFVVEVLSPGTAAIDRGIKFEEYAASGIAEYWIIDPEQQTVEQYVLQNEAYELLLKIKSGEISSEVVQGFTIPVAAIFDRKFKNQVLAQMLNT
jgi:Uma2 family endonuclease